MFFFQFFFLRFLGFRGWSVALLITILIKYNTCYIDCIVARLKQANLKKFFANYLLTLSAVCQYILGYCF